MINEGADDDEVDCKVCVCFVLFHLFCSICIEHILLKLLNQCHHFCSIFCLFWKKFQIFSIPFLFAQKKSTCYFCTKLFCYYPHWRFKITPYQIDMMVWKEWIEHDLVICKQSTTCKLLIFFEIDGTDLCWFFFLSFARKQKKNPSDFLNENKCNYSDNDLS